MWKPKWPTAYIQFVLFHLLKAKYFPPVISGAPLPQKSTLLCTYATDLSRDITGSFHSMGSWLLSCWQGPRGWLGNRTTWQAWFKSTQSHLHLNHDLQTGSMYCRPSIDPPSAWQKSSLFAIPSLQREIPPSVSSLGGQEHGFRLPGIHFIFNVQFPKLCTSPV